MSNRPSPSFKERLSFTSYLELSTYRSMNDCVDRIRNHQGKQVWLGGHLTRFVGAKPTQANQIRFQLEYYRLRESNGAPSAMAQLLTAAMYEKDGETHLLAKVHFTWSALFWLWLGIALNFAPIFLLLYTGNVIAASIVVLTAPFLLAMCAVMWFDRRTIVNIIRRSVEE